MAKSRPLGGEGGVPEEVTNPVPANEEALPEIDAVEALVRRAKELEKRKRREAIKKEEDAREGKKKAGEGKSRELTGLEEKSKDLSARKGELEDGVKRLETARQKAESLLSGEAVDSEIETSAKILLDNIKEKNDALLAELKEIEEELDSTWLRIRAIRDDEECSYYLGEQREDYRAEEIGRKRGKIFREKEVTYDEAENNKRLEIEKSGRNLADFIREKMGGDILGKVEDRDLRGEGYLYPFLGRKIFGKKYNTVILEEKWHERPVNQKIFELLMSVEKQKKEIKMAETKRDKAWLKGKYKEQLKQLEEKKEELEREIKVEEEKIINIAQEYYLLLANLKFKGERNLRGIDIKIKKIDDAIRLKKSIETQFPFFAISVEGKNRGYNDYSHFELKVDISHEKLLEAFPEEERGE
ncbi:MAG TPA: hypothetical protein VJB41_00755 [Patescibacteria group bacterium]|nr:hypothetical protein [Patescibacteria group bacterium]